jgi:hypothetical protein
MNCKILDFSKTNHCYNITNEANGKSVWMPDKEGFEYIRYRMDPLEGHNNTIADAYAFAGGNLGNGYEKLIPIGAIVPCIKRIYTNYHVLNQSGIQVFQPFGQWVLDEACKCLQEITDTNRFDLGDGFIVPNENEWQCIINGMFNSGKTLAEAISLCVPDINYPRTIMKFLEDAIMANTDMGYPRYNIIRVAHSAWIVSNTPKSRITLDNGLVVPSSDEIYKIEYAMFEYDRTLTNAYTINGWADILPPENLLECIEGKIRGTSDTWESIFNSCQASDGIIVEPKKSNTLLYVALGVGALLLLTRK